MLGILLVKTLIVINPQSKLCVSDVTFREPLVVRPDYGLLEMLALFRRGHCHLAFVSNDALTARTNLRNGLPQENASLFIGIVTFEDVVEQILQDEIIDETDVPSFIPGIRGRSTVFHHNASGINSCLPRILSPTSKLRTPELERRLTHFVAHNPSAADVFTPVGCESVLIMKNPASKYTEMIKHPVSLSTPNNIHIVDYAEAKIEDSRELLIFPPR